MTAIVEFLCCVRCKGDLQETERELRCVSCGARFPIRFGFPDFRSSPDSQEELANILRIEELYPASTYEQLIEFHYRRLREGRGGDAPAGQIAQWALEHKHYVGSIDRFGELHLRGVRDEQAKLGRVRQERERVLDIGCGWGRDLLALARAYGECWGIDVEPGSLLYAKKLVEERGLSSKVRLVLAEAEHLPFRDGVFDFVNASAVIEHVQSPEQMGREARRVLRAGGSYHFYYPNRFSLLPETHTSLWGVGFLPRALQLRYAERFRGIDFRGTRLFSFFAMRRQMRHTFGRGNYRIAGVTSGTKERALASKYASLVGRGRLERLFTLYGKFERVPVLSLAAFFFLPIHYVTCRRDETVAPVDAPAGVPATAGGGA